MQGLDAVCIQAAVDISDCSRFILVLYTPGLGSVSFVYGRIYTYIYIYTHMYVYVYIYTLHTYMHIYSFGVYRGHRIPATWYRTKKLLALCPAKIKFESGEVFLTAN